MSSQFFTLLILLGVNKRKRKFLFHGAFLLPASPVEFTHSKVSSSATSPWISTHYPHSTSSAILPTSPYPICLKHTLSIAHAGLILPCLTFFYIALFSCPLHSACLFSCYIFYLPTNETRFFPIVYIQSRNSELDLSPKTLYYRQ